VCKDGGGKWIAWDAISESLEFLKLNRQYVELLEEKWKLYQEWAEEPAQQTMKGKKGTRPGKGHESNHGRE
jgi:hypothetical protein